MLVRDQLNTHPPAARYEAFAPAEAKRILPRLEIHYTPKHGGWLNMADSELSILARQCLDQRFDATAPRRAKVAAWEAKRNTQRGHLDWRFTTDDARIKLKRLYPSIHD